MINKTEKQIMKNWRGDLSKPIVSICCMTYNHVSYIAKAVDSFLMQEVDFPFEILIHDDASNDGTSDILEHYSKSFPGLIKLIIQTENQLTQGRRANTNFNFPRVKGEFVAICEGDDFWTSKHKLKLQVDALKPLKLNLCFHSTVTLKYFKDNKVKELSGYGFFGTKKRIVNFNEILIKGGNAIPASSILIRNSVLLDLQKAHPDFYIDRLTHFYIQLFGSLEVGALYIPKDMSTYRSNIKGSWSYDNLMNMGIFKKNSINYINSLILFNEISHFKYSKDIDKLIRRKVFSLFKSKLLSIKDKITILALRGIDGKLIMYKFSAACIVTLACVGCLLLFI